MLARCLLVLGTFSNDPFPCAFYLARSGPDDGEYDRYNTSVLTERARIRARLLPACIARLSRMRERKG